MTADRPPVSGEPRTDHHGGTIRIPIDVVIANALEVPEAPWEMDTVQGRDAWESGYEAALNAVRALTGEVRATPPALDFDSANALLSAYNYWVNEHPDATVGDRYDWTERYLARLAEQEGEGRG